MMCTATKNEKNLVINLHLDETVHKTFILWILCVVLLQHTQCDEYLFNIRLLFNKLSLFDFDV